MIAYFNLEIDQAFWDDFVMPVHNFFSASSAVTPNDVFHLCVSVSLTILLCCAVPHVN